MNNIIAGRYRIALTLAGISLAAVILGYGLLGQVLHPGFADATGGIEKTL